jgi:ATP-dependent protease HslVU (ClpYQ) peptidase subunit
MTVIACKDGIMAADSKTWCGSVATAQCVKIHRLLNGGLFAGAGWTAAIQQAEQWLNDDAVAEKKPPPAEKDDLNGIFLDRDGLLWWVSHRFDVYRCHGEIAAAGAHSEFLYGAMFSGLSAEEAVRLAIEHCAYAGGKVQVERL